ncbi:MAG: hypothetical protein ACOYJ1_03950 [Peptococcales bacterium]
MTRYLEKVYVISVVFLLAIIFLKEFVDFAFLDNIGVAFLMLVLIPGVILAKGIPFYMSVVSLVLGHILLFKYNMPYSIWLEGITKNLPLATIFLMVPILSIPLKEGGYLETVNFLISKNISKTCGLFFTISSSLFGLASIANLGAVRVFHDLIKDVKLPVRFLGKAYCAGFSGCIAWSPYFASVNLVLYYTGVPFNEYFLVGFIYGLIVLVTGNLLFIRDRVCQNEVKSQTHVIQEPEDSKKKFKYLMLNLIGLFIAVIIGEKYFNFSNMMFWVSMLALVYAFIWSFLIGKFKEFLVQMGNYDQKIVQVKNELIFFLCVGFIGVILANTPLQGIIESFFTIISGYSTFIVVELIIVVTALLSAIGIHHVITLTAIGLSIQGHILGLSDITYSLTLIAAYTISMITSPFAPFNIISGGLFNESSFVVSLKWNRIFAITLVPISGIFIIVLNYFI